MFIQNLQLAIVMKDDTFDRENYNDDETIRSVPRLFFQDIPSNLET